MARSRKKKRSLVTKRRNRPGAPPGTLTADPAAESTTIRVIAYDAEGHTDMSGASLEDVARIRKTGRKLWVDVTGLADTARIENLGAMFQVDQLVLEDVMNIHQRPKAEDYPTNIFIVMHMVDGKTATSREQFSMVLGADYLLTFQERPGDCLSPVRERLERGKPRVRSAGTDYLAYALIDAVIDAYFPLAESLGDQLEMMEDAITLRPTPADVADLHDAKRDLLSIKRSLWPLREMMSELRAEDSTLVTAETRRYLRDAHDHVLQLIDIVETYRELASGLHDLYLSSLSNRMNEVMKVLTIISTIFIPLSFLAGIWGMNFEHMPELHQPWGYPAALAFMAFVAFGLLGWFRWRKWI